MKIALIGYGKMGKAIKASAYASGIEVSVIMDSRYWKENLRGEAKTFAGADVAIDFSRPEGVIDHIKEAARQGTNMVIGTTGWESQVNEAKGIVDTANIGVIASPNFSLGVAIFLKIVKEAALLFNQTGYDVALTETHHALKADAPSGTAKAIAEILLKHIDRKKRITSGTPGPEEISVSSTRVGNYPGEHEVIFDCPSDTIRLSHTARDRSGFVEGALTAARWIQEKKGFFTMDDLVADTLNTRRL